MNIANSLKWSFVGEFIAKLLQPLFFITLVKILTPEDYGILTCALMVIGFTQIFIDYGFGKSLIQTQENIDKASNIVFWINSFIGLFFSIILLFFSDFIAEFIFKNNKVSDVLKVMSLQIFLSSLSSVFITLKQKTLDFKPLFWVRLFSIGFPGLIAIYFAYSGYGYWSLIYASVVGQLIQLVFLLKVSDWRPNFSFDFVVAKKLMNFSSWVLLTGLVSWFYVWMDSLVVGYNLSLSDLGIYRNGNFLAGMIFILIFSPISPVLYSYLSKMQHNQLLISNISNEIFRISTLLSLPFAIIIFSESDLIAELIFGEEWIGIGNVIGFMALMHGFSWIVGMSGDFYRAVNKPSYESKINLAFIIIYFVGYIISIKISFESFVFTRFLLAITALIGHLLLMKYALKTNILSIILDIIKTILIVIFSILISKYLLFFEIDSILLKTLFNTGLPFVISIIFIFLFYKKSLVDDYKSVFSLKK